MVPSPSWRRLTLPLLLLTLLAVTACGSAADIGEAVTSTSTTTERTTAASRPATTTTTVPDDIVESGMYVVGDTIAPGTYRVAGYWARLDGNQEIIDNDLTDSGMTVVNVAPTDSYIEIRGAARPLASVPNIDPVAEGYTDGTYLVGADIAPGRYNVTSAGSSAYAARLDANGEIIDNNLSDGNVIIVVDPGDWALSFTGTLAAMP